MSEAMEEIQRLTNEVESLQAVDADREKHFALLKEREVELNRQLDRTTEARDRFRDSLYRLADIVGLTGNRCFSPEAVERQAKYELATIREERERLKDFVITLEGRVDDCAEEVISLEARLKEAEGERDRATARLEEAREHRDQEQAEIERLKKAAVGCDHRIFGCPVVTPQEVDLLDPVEAYIETAPSTDFGEGVTCPLCKGGFIRLSELPFGDSRVRCAYCNHAFDVRREPDQDAADEADARVEVTDEEGD